MSVLEASWEHHGSTTLLSRPACQGLAPVLILGLGQAEESPPPDPLMEGWVLDPQHQRGAFRCSRDPQLWAFGGSRSHRTCLTSCSSQTHWHFFFFWEATPAARCQSEGWARPGHAGCQDTGRDAAWAIGRERRSGRGKEAGLSSPGLDFLPSSFQVL